MHRKTTALLSKIKDLPLGVIISGAAVTVTLIIYAVIFFTVKPVAFSYSGDSCIKYPLLFPDAHKVVGTSGYDVYATDRVTVAGFTLVSASLCFTPKEAPSEGKAEVALAPYGAAIARKNFMLSIPSQATVNSENLTKPIPLSKSLTINLSETDSVFTYKLEIDDKSTMCKSSDTQLLCDIRELNLQQGKSYHLKLQRLFKEQQIATVVDQDVATLSATKVVDSTIKPGETLYSKSKSFDISLDKKIVKAEATLYRYEDDQRTLVASTTAITDAGLKIEAADDLVRQVKYEVVIHSVEAIDGSGLEESYSTSFKTSGGPKVTGVSVGRTGVGLGTTAVISFDQILSESQDTASVVNLGGGASYAGKRSNQLLVSLKNVPKCGDFNIQIIDGLQSNYEITGGTAWTFSGRMICHTIETIGYSSKGRPINAYYFGSGPRVVMYTGAIHGNEIGTRYLMDRWVQDLEASARSIPSDKTVVVIPQLNPDGVASGSRVNARNVDLNRNFATSDWQKDITDVNNRPFPGGGGQSPMSEPETRAIAALAQRLRPILIASYHSIGGVVAGNQAGNSVSMAGVYSQLSGYQNVTGQTGETFDYSVTGTADDWYAAMGIPSLLVELSSHTSAQFERNQKAMWRIVNL